MQEANGAKKSSLFISSSVHIHTLHIDACIATYLKVRESVENYGGEEDRGEKWVGKIPAPPAKISFNKSC